VFGNKKTLNTRTINIIVLSFLSFMKALNMESIVHENIDAMSEPKQKKTPPKPSAVHEDE